MRCTMSGVGAGQRSRNTWGPLRVVNVVYTCQFVPRNQAGDVTHLDLRAVARRLHNVDYFPSRFAALKLCRTVPSFSKGLLFRSGKLVSVGNHSVDSGAGAVQWFKAELEPSELHFSKEFSRFYATHCEEDLPKLGPHDRIAIQVFAGGIKRTDVQREATPSRLQRRNCT